MTSGENSNENLQRLRDAISRELVDDPARTAAFSRLLIQMAEFEFGQGMSPTINEFLIWRTAVEVRNARRHFNTGRGPKTPGTKSGPSDS